MTTRFDGYSEKIEISEVTSIQLRGETKKVAFGCFNTFFYEENFDPLSI